MFPRRRSIYVWALLVFGASSAQAVADDTPNPPSEQEYWAQYARKDWDQAILAAEKLIEAARLNAVAAPLELAEALSLLGGAQVANRNYVAAEAAFAEALQIVEPRVVATSDKLLEPLTGLGFTLTYAGKYAAAIPVLERAIVVSRRGNGLFNPKQQGLLRQLAMCFIKTGDYMGAAQQMQYLLRVGQHTYGEKDPRMSGIFTVIGDFYLQAGSVSTAREAYGEALRVVERRLGKQHLGTVEPLRAYAETYRRELYLSYYGLRTNADQRVEPAQSDPKLMNPRYLNAEGERALQRALKTLDAHPEHSAAQLFDTLLDLGDWYTIKNQPDAAMPYYKRAVELIEQVEPEQRDAARTKLTFPVQVYYPVPLSATRNLNRPDEEVDERFVHVAFTVKADGTVENESVIEQNASARHASETLAAIRSARYRPKFANGEPVNTPDVSIRQVFRLRKDRETE